MKGTFIICLIILFSGVVIAQEGPITIEKKGLKKTYLNSGEPIEFKELSMLLKSNPASMNQFSSYKTNSSIGLASMAVGTVFIGVGLYYTIKSAQEVNNNNLSGTTEYSDKSTSAMLIGAGFYLVSVPFHIFAKSHLTNSINFYNSSPNPDSHSPQMILYYGLTDYGVGVGLKF